MDAGDRFNLSNNIINYIMGKINIKAKNCILKFIAPKQKVARYYYDFENAEFYKTTATTLDGEKKLFSPSAGNVGTNTLTEVSLFAQGHQNPCFVYAENGIEFVKIFFENSDVLLGQTYAIYKIVATVWNASGNAESVTKIKEFTISTNDLANGYKVIDFDSKVYLETNRAMLAVGETNLNESVELPIMYQYGIKPKEVIVHSASPELAKTQGIKMQSDSSFAQINNVALAMSIGYYDME